MISSAGYCDQCGVFGLDKSLQHVNLVKGYISTCVSIGKTKRLYHSCPFWIKCKWKASTYTLISLSWRKPLKTLQKCETAKPGEFLGVNPPFRTTDSNQVFGVRGPRLWNIRFCSVCSHQERSTWATWLTHWGLPWVLIQWRFPYFVMLQSPRRSASQYRRPLNALYNAAWVGGNFVTTILSNIVDWNQIGRMHM